VPDGTKFSIEKLVLTLVRFEGNTPLVGAWQGDQGKVPF